VTVNGLKVKKGSALMAAMAAKSELLQARSGLPRRVDLRKWMTPVRKMGMETRRVYETRHSITMIVL
jgi:hypothetical protein